MHNFMLSVLNAIVLKLYLDEGVKPSYDTWSGRLLWPNWTKINIFFFVINKIMYIMLYKIEILKFIFFYKHRWNQIIIRNMIIIL